MIRINTASGSSSGSFRVGGLTGSSSGTIINSYTTGTITIDSESEGMVGGLVGFSSGSQTIKNSYTRSVIKSPSTSPMEIGVFIGQSQFQGKNTTIIASYFDTAQTGQTPGIGYIPWLNEAKVSYPSESELSGVNGNQPITGTPGNYQIGGKQAFTDWDFENVWNPPSQGWPTFKWAETPPPVIEITTADNLRKIGTEDSYPLDRDYRLTADITLSGNWTPIGSGSNPFMGNFDGGGFTISGLRITRNSNHLGLFAQIGNVTTTSQEIKDLNISSPFVEGSDYDYIGTLAGISHAYITRVEVTKATVNGGDYVGGLVGIFSSHPGASITNSHVDASVTGAKAVGGLVGFAGGLGLMTTSYAEGTVKGTDKVGGLVGEKYFLIIKNSYAANTVTGETSVGGLVGLVGTHLPSGETGILTLDPPEIYHSYASGKINGTNLVGGLVGSDDYDFIKFTNSYFNTTVNSLLPAIGFPTSRPSTPAGTTGINTSDITLTTFAGWDTTIWNFAASQWPTLR